MSRLSHVNLSLSPTGDLPAAIYWSGIAPFYPREDLPRLELENGEEFSTSHFRPVLLRNDLPFTAVCYMFWAMLLLEGMAPISHVFFSQAPWIYIYIDLDQTEFLNCISKRSMKHSIAFTSALGGFVLFDLAGFKIRILDKFIFWWKEVTDWVLNNSRRNRFILQV